MSRYVKDLATGLSPEEAMRVTEEYLRGEGFQYKNWRGEMVWQKGEGLMASPQFIRVSPGTGAVRVEAWIAGIALLPGIYIGESGIDGAWGFAVKAALKPRVAELERRLGATAAPTAAPAVAEA